MLARQEPRPPGNALLIRRPADLLEIAADFRLVHLLAEMREFGGRLAALVRLVVLCHDIVVPVGGRPS